MLTKKRMSPSSLWKQPIQPPSCPVEPVGVWIDGPVMPA